MPDVNVDPVAARNVIKVMNQHKDTIIADLDDLLTKVTALLTNDGGLWLKQSSPVMSVEFATFQKNLRDAIANIQNFGESFESTVKNLEELDLGYSKPSETADA